MTGYFLLPPPSLDVSATYKGRRVINLTIDFATKFSFSSVKTTHILFILPTEIKLMKHSLPTPQTNILVHNSTVRNKSTFCSTLDVKKKILLFWKWVVENDETPLGFINSSTLSRSNHTPVFTQSMIYLIKTFCSCLCDVGELINLNFRNLTRM